MSAAAITAFVTYMAKEGFSSNTVSMSFRCYVLT
jgi:hypothetical protein